MNTDAGTASSIAEKRYNEFMYKTQTSMKPNSKELRERINKLRADREKVLKRRRTAREKVEKGLKECKMAEYDLEDLEARIRSEESQCQTALMKEAERDEYL